VVATGQISASRVNWLKSGRIAGNIKWYFAVDACFEWRSARDQNAGLQGNFQIGLAAERGVLLAILFGPGAYWAGKSSTAWSRQPRRCAIEVEADPGELVDAPQQPDVDVETGLKPSGMLYDACRRDHAALDADHFTIGD
jgi:hypothetical protein